VHCSAQFSQLLGVGCAYHSTHCRITQAAHCSFAPIFTHITHNAVYRFAIYQLILQFTRRLVRGFTQYKDTFITLIAVRDERGNSIGAEITVHRKRVAAKRLYLII